MTQEEAEKVVKDMWGEYAFAFCDNRNQYWVGESNGPINVFYGCGKNWEEALKKATLNLN